MTILTLALIALAPFASQAPLPSKLIEAKTACIVNAGTKQEYVDKLHKELTKTKRFDLVGDEDKADVLILLGDKNSGAVTVPVAGVFISAELEGFVLSIVETETKKPLWSDAEAVSWTFGGAITALVKRLDKRLGPKR